MSERVLLVDDEPNIVTSLQFLMRKSGFETSVARDGDAALAEVERFRPDLVLLDAMMLKAFDDVWRLSDEHEVEPRLAAHALAIGRVAEATRTRGIFP